MTRRAGFGIVGASEPVDILWTVDTTAGAAVQGNQAAPEPGNADDGAPPGPAAQSWLPGRRAITVWFAVFALYAGAEIFTRHADGTWGAWACGGYAVTTLLLLVTRNWLAPLAAAIAGAFLAPLIWMIVKVPDTSTAEVVVINRSADYLVRHGTPYLPASLITDWQHYNPYLPLMELFGLPRKAGFPGLLGDPRIWTSLVTVAALTAAFALMASGARLDRRRQVAVLAAISVSSPLVAFPLTVGVTDPPIIALTCLTLALAGATPRPQVLRLGRGAGTRGHDLGSRVPPGRGQVHRHRRRRGRPARAGRRAGRAGDPGCHQAEPHRLPAWHVEVQDGGGQPAARPPHLPARPRGPPDRGRAPAARARRVRRLAARPPA